MSRNLGRFTILAVAAALTVAFAAPAMADTTWTNLAGDGDWANGGNWDNGVPSTGGGTIVYFTGTTGPTNTSVPGVSNAREIHMTAPTNIGINIDWCGWGGVGLVSAEAPGAYSIGSVGSHSLWYVAQGATLTQRTSSGGNVTLTGLGTLIKNGAGMGRYSIAGGTLDLNNSDLGWGHANAISIGSKEWGVDTDRLSGYGKITSSVITGGSRSTINFNNAGGAGLAFSLTGALTIEDAPMALHTADVYDFTDVTFRMTTFAGMWEPTNYQNGDSSKYFLRVGDFTSNPYTLKNITLEGKGNMVGCAGRGMYGYQNINHWDAAATVALDGATVDMSHLGMDGNLAFSGAKSTVVIDVTGAGGVAGVDFSQILVQTTSENGYINVGAGGYLTGIDNVNLKVNITEGLVVPGPITIFDVARTDFRLGGTVGGLNFNSVTVNDGRGTAEVAYNNGSITLSNISFGSLPLLEKTWVATTTADFNAEANWTTSGIDGSKGTRLIFAGNSPVPQIVYMERPSTANMITFDVAGSYILAGIGLTLTGSGRTAEILVNQGFHEFQNRVRLGSATDVIVNSALTFNNALLLDGNVLTKTGAGTMFINNQLDLGTGGQIVVNEGTVNISGQLVLALGSIPSAPLTLLDVGSGSVGGTFYGLNEGAEVDLGYGGTTYKFTISYTGGTGNDVVLNPIPAHIPGDINGDNIVDQADYTVWYNHYGQTPATWADGDVTGDSIVDQADYTVWYNNYGSTGGNVPEPMTMALLAIGGVALLRRKK